MRWKIRKKTFLIAGGAVLTLLGAGALAFHPSRPLYIDSRDVAVTTDDGVILRGTLSLPRWKSRPVPGVVLVHGSGPLTRRDVLGDTRRLVWSGIAVLAYDKRGAGESGGTYLRSRDVPPDTLLRRLAADAAAAFELLTTDPDIDAGRSGFFGASQAGWIIPLAAERTVRRPAFHVILSGPAVSTGVEQYYSDLTGDGLRPPVIADRAEVEQRVSNYTGVPGFDPTPVLAASEVPTLWILGDRDASVPTFATVRVLEALRASGNDAHTVMRFAEADHGLRDSSGRAVPFWDPMLHFLRTRAILPR
jgi:dienelactone hydrolase